MRRKKLILLAPLAIVGLLLFISLGGVIVQQLWNWLLPPLFGFRLVTFWQALGILVLGRILFGGFGFHRGGSSSHVRRGVVDKLADRIGERFAAMTPEERERFRQRLRERCGFDPSSAGSTGQ